MKTRKQILEEILRLEKLEQAQIVGVGAVKLKQTILFMKVTLEWCLEDPTSPAPSNVIKDILS